MNNIEKLQAEMSRVRDIIKKHRALPDNEKSFITKGMMLFSVQSAELAISLNDTLGMEQAFKDLEKYKL